MGNRRRLRQVPRDNRDLHHIPIMFERDIRTWWRGAGGPSAGAVGRDLKCRANRLRPLKTWPRIRRSHLNGLASVRIQPHRPTNGEVPLSLQSPEVGAYFRLL